MFQSISWASLTVVAIGIVIHVCAGLGAGQAKSRAKRHPLAGVAGRTTLISWQTQTSGWNRGCCESLGDDLTAFSGRLSQMN